MDARSWWEELDAKYQEIFVEGLNEDLDKANEAILKAIDELNKIKSESPAFKSKGE